MFAGVCMMSAPVYVSDEEECVLESTAADLGSHTNARRFQAPITELSVISPAETQAQQVRHAHTCTYTPRCSRTLEGAHESVMIFFCNCVPYTPYITKYQTYPKVSQRLVVDADF